MKKKLTITQTFDLAVQNHKKNNFKVAMNLYSAILNKEPNDFKTIFSLGSLLLQVRKFIQAKPLFEKIIQADPSNVIAHNNLGLTFKELGEPLKAIGCFEKAIQIDPKFSIAHNNLGTSYKDLNEYKQAISFYEKAIQIDPNYINAYNNLGLIFMELEEHQKAIDHYKKAIQINPNFANTHNNLGVTFMELDEYKKAISSFERAIEINPNHTDASHNLLRFLFKMENQSIFLKKLDERIKQGENNALIGSLSIRSEIKYGIKRTNPFCSDPLKYILINNLKEQYDFQNIFVNVFKDIIKDDIVLRRKQNLLTNGYQTAGNLFAQKSILIDNIKDTISSEIKNYHFHFRNSNEGFIKNWPANYNLNGWLVSMKSGGKISPHIHEKGWISGSIYINVPKKLKTNSGDLVVSINDEENTAGNKTNQKKIINVVTGSLCLFPSSLYHYTIPFEAAEDRIVLAFDVIPN